VFAYWPALIDKKAVKPQILDGRAGFSSGHS